MTNVIPGPAQPEQPKSDTIDFVGMKRAIEAEKEGRAQRFAQRLQELQAELRCELSIEVMLNAQGVHPMLKIIAKD